jgi:hypothetical protein
MDDRNSEGHEGGPIYTQTRASGGDPPGPLSAYHDSDTYAAHDAYIHAIRGRVLLSDTVGEVE